MTAVPEPAHDITTIRSQAKTLTLCGTRLSLAALQQRDSISNDSTAILYDVFNKLLPHPQAYRHFHDALCAGAIIEDSTMQNLHDAFKTKHGGQDVHTALFSSATEKSDLGSVELFEALSDTQPMSQRLRAFGTRARRSISVCRQPIRKTTHFGQHFIRFDKLPANPTDPPVRC